MDNFSQDGEGTLFQNSSKALLNPAPYLNKQGWKFITLGMVWLE